MTAVDGKKLTQPQTIDVVGIDKWPNKTKAKLKGSQHGVLRFLHVGDTNLPLEAEKNFRPKQRLFLDFITSEVIGPKGLPIPERR